MNMGNADMADPIERIKKNNFGFDEALPPRTIDEAIERLLKPLTFHEKTRLATIPDEKLEGFFLFLHESKTSFVSGETICYWNHAV